MSHSKNTFFIPGLPNLDEAVSIAAEGFVRSVSLELQIDVKNHLTDKQTAFSVVDENGRVVGFALFKSIGGILYLAGLILRRDYQNRGLGKEAILAGKFATKAEYFALRTQSPRMWSVGNSLASAWYPNLTGLPNKNLEQKAKILATELGMIAPIVQGFYGGPLYGEKPTHQNSDLQARWDSLCSFERGDAVLCVGRF